MSGASILISVDEDDRMLRHGVDMASSRSGGDNLQEFRVDFGACCYSVLFFYLDMFVL